MSGLLDALIPAATGIFGSLTVYAGTRYTAKRSARSQDQAQETENRRVSLAEFEKFKEAYYEHIEEFEARYEAQERKMNTVERLLRLALKHIRDLRSDMQQHEVIPSHRTPPELESLLWTMTDDEPVPPAPRRGE